MEGTGQDEGELLQSHAEMASEERERRRKLCNVVAEMKADDLRNAVIAFIDESGDDVVGHLAARIGWKR